MKIGERVLVDCPSDKILNGLECRILSKDYAHIYRIVDDKGNEALVHIRFLKNCKE
jgi:hypothetical protein